MELFIKVKETDGAIITILGKIYYKQEYAEEMFVRQYEKGKIDGRQIHIVQIEECRNCK